MQKTFFQYFKYELRYDFLKLDKFVPRTRGTPMKNKSKFKRFIVLSPFLFKINITHDCLLSNLEEKENFQLRKNQENSLVTSTMSSDQRF